MAPELSLKAKMFMRKTRLGQIAEQSGRDLPWPQSLRVIRAAGLEAPGDAPAGDVAFAGHVVKSTFLFKLEAYTFGICG